MSEEENFNRIYETERKKIDRLLASALSRRKPHSLYEPVIYILNNPGKRLRPFFVLISAKAGGGAFKQAYNAALAMEMLHTFTLAHDDIMDNADKRRGHLTLHKKYDLSTAILAGDSLLSVAYEFLLKDIRGGATEIIKMFTRSLIEVCEGQSMDKEFEIRKDVKLPDYLTMITKKTAVMVETCCAIGAMIVGADKEVVRGLRSFGKNIGIAFQIQDDLLDITADEAKFGKMIGGDLIEGKKTYLFLKAAEKAKGKDLLRLTRVIANKGIQRSEVDEYRALYDRLGVLQDARAAVNAYTGRALQSLRMVPAAEDRHFFYLLSQRLIKRTS